MEKKKKGFIEYPVSKREALDMGFNVDELNHYGDTYITYIDAGNCKNWKEVQRFLWADAKKTQRTYGNVKNRNDFTDDLSEEESFREPIASLDFLAELGSEACAYIEKGYTDFETRYDLECLLKKLEETNPQYARYIRAYYLSNDKKPSYKKIADAEGKGISCVEEQIKRGIAILKYIDAGVL